MAAVGQISHELKQIDARLGKIEQSISSIDASLAPVGSLAQPGSVRGLILLGDGVCGGPHRAACGIAPVDAGAASELKAGQRVKANTLRKNGKVAVRLHLNAEGELSVGMIKRATLALLALGAGGFLGGLLGGCAATLPSLEGRTASSALADTAGTRLGRALATEVAAHPGQSGVHAAVEPARRLRGARRARGGRGQVARRAVLHLARRHRRQPAVRGAVAGGRARRARAPAARRQQHRRARPDAGRAGRAPEHRGAPVQPVRAARRRARWAT